MVRDGRTATDAVCQASLSTGASSLARMAGTTEHTTPPTPERPLSALPSVGVRVAAFASIVLAGLAGGLIGYSLVDLQCDGDCGLPKGLGILAGAIVSAGGMAIVAVLVMRALGEWREVQDRERAGHAP